jgi:DNA-binding NarL/FixJ family response regulator
MEAQRKISVLVADELTLVREGLAALCEQSPRIHVSGQCADGEAALRYIETKQPDVALLDLNLPRLYCLEIVHKVRAADYPTKLVVLSLRRDRKTIIEVLRSGAHGIVLKAGPSRHLFDAVTQVFDGGVYVSPLLELDKVFSSPRAKKPEDPLELLSAREYQVFSLLVDGLRAKEVAARLTLSPKTVDTYRSSLMRKLGIHDLAGLVKFAVQRSLTAMP